MKKVVHYLVIIQMGNVDFKPDQSLLQRDGHVRVEIVSPSLKPSQINMTTLKKRSEHLEINILKVSLKKKNFPKY